MAEYRALLVTGTRQELSAVGKALVYEVVQNSLQNYPNASWAILHGDCPTGVDKYVQDCFGIFTLPMPAPWDRLGRKAGQFRNEQLVIVARALRSCLYKVEGLAFPAYKGSGTRGCIKLAKAVQIPMTTFELEKEHLA